jgi:wyosine [tRNA(Phe)-imidazoG37] synthetase (radical SAM superfamily)
VEQIRPEKIQINTVVRPPADRKAISIDKNRLEELKELFGERSEIIAGTPVGTGQWQRDTLSEDIIEMVKRRPLRIVDISMSLGMPGDEIEPVIKGLLIKGYIIRQEHLGEIYYSGNE